MAGIGIMMSNTWICIDACIHISIDRGRERGGGRDT